MTGAMEREAGEERRGCGVGRIDSGRGLEPKRGVNVAVLKFEEGSAFFHNRQL